MLCISSEAALNRASVFFRARQSGLETILLPDKSVGFALLRPQLGKDLSDCGRRPDRQLIFIWVAVPGDQPIPTDQSEASGPPDPNSLAELF